MQYPLNEIANSVRFGNTSYAIWQLAYRIGGIAKLRRICNFAQTVFKICKRFVFSNLEIRIPSKIYGKNLNNRAFRIECIAILEI